MRCGDSYKIKALLKNGLTEDQVVAYFKNSYQEEEVRRFIQKPETKAEPKLKRKRRTKAEMAAARGE